MIQLLSKVNIIQGSLFFKMKQFIDHLFHLQLHLQQIKFQELLQQEQEGQSILIKLDDIFFFSFLIQNYHFHQFNHLFLLYFQNIIFYNFIHHSISLKSLKSFCDPDIHLQTQKHQHLQHLQRLIYFSKQRSLNFAKNIENCSISFLIDPKDSSSQNYLLNLVLELDESLFIDFGYHCNLQLYKLHLIKRVLIFHQIFE